MSRPITAKRAGYCSLCDELIFEVVQRYVGGPLDGEVMEFGGPVAGAYRATLLMLSGSHADYSFCQKCRPTPENLPYIWRRELAAHVLETSAEWRALRDMQPYTHRQREAKDKRLQKSINDMPIGIICTTPWREVYDGREAA